MRAKFTCESVTSFANVPTIEVRLQPVMDGSEENKEFWKYTPQGRLEMTVTNPNAVDFFQPGTEYYIDFSKAS